MKKVLKQFARHTRLLVALTLAAGSAPAREPSVTVVNIIPKTFSNETHQDSEPNLAVNAANPSQMAASAFTSGKGFCGPDTAPIFVTLDGGAQWALSCIIPSDENGMFSDISLRFAGTTGNLYAGILRHPGEFRLNILRTNNLLGPEPMTVLVDRNNVDQPYVQATTVSDNDRVYVGGNDFDAPNGQTATVDFSLDAHSPSGTFRLSRVEARATGRQNGPAVRTTMHGDGTVYAVFYGWRTLSGDFDPAGTITTDVVVVREDGGASVPDPFNDLKDDDGLSGRRVARERRLPWYADSQPNFGNERFVASNVSIAVDPRPGKSGVVYVAWADRVAEDDYTLHVRNSTDRGATWSDDIRTITDATNPALAVNEDGTLGFLYQKLTGRGESPRWETHLELTAAESAAAGDGSRLSMLLGPRIVFWQDFVLARVPADKPDPQFVPYIGDYIHLMTLGKTFYGIFSANNTPDRESFPNGVVFRRNHDFEKTQLLQTDNQTPVAVSIDPFFFKVTP